MTKPLTTLFDERLQFAQAADEAGFYCMHLAEHHATPLNMVPVPGVFLGSVARATADSFPPASPSATPRQVSLTGPAEAESEGGRRRGRIRLLLVRRVQQAPAVRVHIARHHLAGGRRREIGAATAALRP